MFFLKLETELFTQKLGKELLLYDRSSDVCHHLGEHAAFVWEAIMPDTDTAALITIFADNYPELAEVAEQIVAMTLRDLLDKSLLQGQPPTTKVNQKRRALLKSLGALSILSVTAPLPAAAASPPKLQIVEARYFNNQWNIPWTNGPGGLCSNNTYGVCAGSYFTTQLQGAVTGGNSVSFLCSNGTVQGGDPCVGILKECRVQYKCSGGATQTLRVCEGNTINISCP